MDRDIDRILIPQERIAARVRELARDIIADHTPPRMPMRAMLAMCASESAWNTTTSSMRLMNSGRK